MYGKKVVNPPEFPGVRVIAREDGNLIDFSTSHF